jgi:hypothetical protein
VKDRLEGKLHELVCTGQLDLKTAQQAIAADWIGAYKMYFGRKLRRFFDGGFDASKRLFGLCFNIDRFCKEGQLLVGGFFFISMSE